MEERFIMLHSMQQLLIHALSCIRINVAMRKIVILLILALVWPVTAGAAQWRVLLLTGQGTPGSKQTTPALARLLDRTGLFDVRVVEEPRAINAESLEGYDLVVTNYRPAQKGGAVERCLSSFVEGGKGLVLIHGTGHPLSVEGSPKKLGKKDFHTLKLVDQNHPITRGMAAERIVADELFEDLQPVATAKILANADGRAALWTVARGQGRVFHTALGADVDAMHEPGFAATFARGAEWAASGNTTLVPNWSPDAPRPDAIRVKVTTGHIGTDATFYSLFQRQNDIVAKFPGEPFKEELKDTTDVLVLFDWDVILSDSDKANIRRFLDAGKGLVVLHHALGTYPDWTWWRENVVGCRYIFKGNYKGDPESMASSSVKDGQEFLVRPVMKHPVLDGVGPFHLIDECYKGMWFSPKIQPLLQTDNPLNDPVVAWLGLHPKARVVGIQLGHDRGAHWHPAYQRLVRNALLWTAGRK